jgi:hypothetical protein
MRMMAGTVTRSHPGVMLALPGPSSDIARHGSVSPCRLSLRAKTLVLTRRTLAPVSLAGWSASERELEVNLPNLRSVRLTVSSPPSLQKRSSTAIAYKLVILRRFATSSPIGSIASIDVTDPDTFTSQ